MRFLHKYDLRPAVRRVTLVVALVPLPGCIFVDGTSGGTSGGGSGTVDMPLGDFRVDCPRPPDFGGTTPRKPKDAAELKREIEVCNWDIADAEQRGLDIQYTVQMPSGDFYDWVTPESLGLASYRPRRCQMTISRSRRRSMPWSQS